MSSTDTAKCAISLRACYAISGTDLAYGATTGRDQPCALRVAPSYPPTRSLCDVRYLGSGTIVLRTREAVSGTDVAYRAIVLRSYALTRRCPVLTYAMLSSYPRLLVLAIRAICTAGRGLEFGAKRPAPTRIGLRADVYPAVSRYRSLASYAPLRHVRY
eukprot:3079024-Rhodomonas_salina.1